jgi:hypothetical protein
MRGCFTSLLSSRVSRFRALIAIHSCIPIPMRVPGNTSEFAFDWPFAAEFGRKSQTIEYVTVCAAIESRKSGRCLRHQHVPTSPAELRRGAEHQVVV